jgi:X-Pro dipeptidyl-peptidase (S15 family)/X-Pro dipeptidyl-peptidase C-terminal non-catalytic domain
MSKRGSALAIAGLLAVSGLVSVAPPDRASAQNALIVDSLAALGALVGGANCAEANAAPGGSPDATGLPYRKCDDGLPDGRTGGANGIPVPAAYHATDGNDHSGLPAPATAEEVTAVDSSYDLQPDESGDRITLDVDVSLPPATSRAPKKGYPVIAFMHGCCGGNKTSWQAPDVDVEGERWHHSNAYFAARGYVVVNYTARGFRDGNQMGSSGTTQLDSRRFEINDFQYLVGLLVDDDAAKRAAGEAPLFNVNPKKVAAVGGSYGGGFTWLALTDPTWKSPMSKVPVRLAAAVTKYGWTDLLEALVPSGHYRDLDPQTGKTAVAPSDAQKAPSRNPIGVMKQSIVAGLYATGNAANGNHTTFPQYLHETLALLQAGEPYDSNPQLQSQADDFLNDRSAYFQNEFWNRVGAGLRVPVYSAATWTDPLFPTMEHMRFYNKLKSIAPAYPIVTYLGDYQHFVQNKPKEWDDLCGDDHHICTFGDYATIAGGALNPYKAPTRVRLGVNTRISKFLDFYLKGAGTRPKNDVTSTTTICPSNASDKYPADEPGIEHRAPTWRRLAPRRLTFAWEGGGAATSTTSSLSADGHATGDAVAQNGHYECYAPEDPNPGPGVVQLISEPIAKPFTLMGIPALKLKYTATGSDYWLSARLYEQTADGTLNFVTRGVCRVSGAADASCESFDMWGNAWTFSKDNRVVMELSQGDTPMFRKDNLPSSLQFASAEVALPVAPKTLRHDFRN